MADMQLHSLLYAERLGRDLADDRAGGVGGGIIHRLCCKRDLRERLAVDARILKILCIAEQDRACAADDLRLAAGLPAIGQGVELRGDLRAFHAKVLRMDENDGICGIDEGVFINLSVNLNRVLDMTSRQELAGSRAPAARQPYSCRCAYRRWGSLHWVYTFSFGNFVI